MKKIIITNLFLGSLIGLFLLSSCYDDKSTLESISISQVEISINDKNQEKTIYVGYQSPIDIVPTITQNGFDGSNLQYEWALTEEPTSNNPIYEIISTKKEFHGIINRPISSAAYHLKLTVTDTANDNLQYLYTWKVFVQSSFKDGLLIADSQDGQTSDLTLINNSRLSMEYSQPEKIFRNILKNANGVAYNGLFQSLTYEVYGNAAIISSSHINQIWAITSTGKSVRFDCESYMINGSSEDTKLFLYTPTDFAVYSYFRSSQMFFANTNNGLYCLTNVSGNRFSMPSNVLAGYKIDNNVFASNSSFSINYNHLVWLDSEKGAFYSSSGSNPNFSQCTTYVANTEFNPNELGNQTAIAATSSQDGSLATFLLKDKVSGEYGVFTLSQYKEEQGYYSDPDNYEGWIVTEPERPASAMNKFSVPTNGKDLLDKAVSVFFGHINNVIYVVCDDAVYAFTYGMGKEVYVNTVAQFTPANGEKITMAKLYQQGHYTNQLNVMTGNPPVYTPNELNNKSLIIVTQSEEYKGKVYIIPMKQAGSGTLDVSTALVYEGFGKVLDVIGTGY